MNWKISEKESIIKKVLETMKGVFRDDVTRRSSTYIIMSEGDKKENGCREQSKITERQGIFQN